MNDLPIQKNCPGPQLAPSSTPSPRSQPITAPLRSAPSPLPASPPPAPAMLSDPLSHSASMAMLPTSQLTPAPYTQATFPSDALAHAPPTPPPPLHSPHIPPTASLPSLPPSSPPPLPSHLPLASTRSRSLPTLSDTPSTSPPGPSDGEIQACHRTATEPSRPSGKVAKRNKISRMLGQTGWEQISLL